MWKGEDRRGGTTRTRFRDARRGDDRCYEQRKGGGKPGNPGDALAKGKKHYRIELSHPTGKVRKYPSRGRETTFLSRSQSLRGGGQIGISRGYLSSLGNIKFHPFYPPTHIRYALFFKIKLETHALEEVLNFGKK